MPSSDTLKAAKSRSKNQFDEQDLIAARQIIQAIKPRPLLTRTQFIDALQAELLDALTRGVNVSQLAEALEKQGIPLAPSALVKLQRLSKKRGAPRGTPGSDIAVAPDAVLTHSGEVKLTNLGNTGGRLADDVEPGASSEDERHAPARPDGQSDCQGTGLCAQHGSAPSA